MKNQNATFPRDISRPIPNTDGSEMALAFLQNNYDRFLDLGGHVTLDFSSNSFIAVLGPFYSKFSNYHKNAALLAAQDCLLQYRAFSK